MSFAAVACLQKRACRPPKRIGAIAKCPKLPSTCFMDDLLSRRRQGAWALLPAVVRKCPPVVAQCLTECAEAILDETREAGQQVLSLADYWIWWPKQVRLLGETVQEYNIVPALGT